MTLKRVNSFPLRDFRGVNPEHIARLEAMGIKRAGQLLTAGQTPVKRAALARQAGIPEVALLKK